MCRGEVHPSPAPPLATATHAICARPHPAPTGCGCRLGPSPHHGGARRLDRCTVRGPPRGRDSRAGWLAAAPHSPHRRGRRHLRVREVEPLPAVARTLGITPTQLRRDLTRGSASLPRRLTASDIARRFGWNPSTAHRSHQAGLLPPPDGNEDTGAWWWEHTMEGWAAHRDMHPCPACEVIYPTSTGLRGHLTREHPGS